MSAAPEDPDLDSESQIDEQQETMEPAVDTWSRTKWLGDYKDMVKRRQIRALVPHSKTFFFLDKGKRRGLTYETMMEFEKFLNKELKTRHLKLKV
ncbi:MAG: hypothetical protein GQ559_02565, partial [Desulfobulbaceae bacterium]|nr:hypothetical protein [Desulfobulbaceae bacterium]